MAAILDETLEQQRKGVMAVLEDLASAKPLGDVRFETVFDREHDRYQVMAIGWLDQERLHECVVHIDLRDGMVWIEADSTDFNLEAKLERLGIPKEQIVFAFSKAGVGASG